jgi:O-acetyl-ADP-ribose deacetylase (regulator of RNase III)
MGSGISAALREKAGRWYVRKAQEQCPVFSGTAVVTKPYKLKKHIKGIKYVLHGTVIDYDTEDLSLPESIYETTANCLETAEQLKLRKILFPAFATGSGKASMEECAHQMCGAIKTYLAEERPLEVIYIILYLPHDAKKRRIFEEKNKSFVVEANLVLGVPYNPMLYNRPIRDVYERTVALKRIESVIVGNVKGKKHVVILGGPRSGKRALLDQLFERARKSNSLMRQGRRLFKLTFGRVHGNTPASFVYQKFLCALGKTEKNAAILREIEKTYADPNLDCDGFLGFLKHHARRYRQVVFLVDHLPKLLDMEDEGSDEFKDIRTFWSDIDRLEDRVRFIYTASDDAQYRLLLTRLSGKFKDQLEVIRLKCVSKEESKRWVNKLYRRYLQREATSYVHDFIEEEAGQHPYLISLVCFALVEALKRDAMKNSANHPKAYTRQFLERFFRKVRQTIEEPRRAFFNQLLGTIERRHLVDLHNLAKAVAIEEERQLLVRDLRRKDVNAKRRWQELQDEMDPRDNLHRNTLRELEMLGHLVNAEQPKEVQFVAKHLKSYVQEYYRLNRRHHEDGRPKDMVISLLNPEPHTIRTIIHSRGAMVFSAQKRLTSKTKGEFMSSFGQCINHYLHPVKHREPGVFRDVGMIGSYIFSQFATASIKRYLKDLPHGSTVLMMIEDTLKDIPWELMLETVYAGEIPFRVGRSIISTQHPSCINIPVHQVGKIRTLLIGNPTDDLKIAQREVEWLAYELQHDEKFAEPDVLVGGKDCKRIKILNYLGSGDYGLIHYSGHTSFDGEHSTWHVKDGKITTDMLTNALQTTPPVLVFSSSCESAKASGSKPVGYENQTFDLPSAFLQAGVEVYIGTLWEVPEGLAQQFVKEFYTAFLSAEYDVGECMRRAKWACKRYGRWQDRINWLAFVLYANPHATPGDLFPLMRVSKNQSAF